MLIPLKLQAKTKGCEPWSLLKRNVFAALVSWSVGGLALWIFGGYDGTDFLQDSIN